MSRTIDYSKLTPREKLILKAIKQPQAGQLIAWNRAFAGLALYGRRIGRR